MKYLENSKTCKIEGSDGLLSCLEISIFQFNVRKDTMKQIKNENN